MVRISFLDQVLVLLVAEFGEKRVRSALESAVKSGSIADLRTEGSRQKVSRTALELASNADLESPTKEALARLAAQFDNKSILVSPRDIRELLIDFGDRPRAIKNRSDGFALIISTLRRLHRSDRANFLQAMENSSPAQFRLISDAITSVGRGLSVASAESVDPDADQSNRSS